MRARPDIAGRASAPRARWSARCCACSPALGTHGHPGRGAGRRHVLGRLHLRRRRSASALRPGLRRGRPGGRGLRRRRLRLWTVAHHLVRLLGERGLHLGRPGLGLPSRGMALRPRPRSSSPPSCSRACRSTCCTTPADPRHADGARGARPGWRCSRSASSSARPSACPSRADRRPLGRAAGFWAARSSCRCWPSGSPPPSARHRGRAPLTCSRSQFAGDTAELDRAPRAA